MLIDTLHAPETSARDDSGLQLAGDCRLIECRRGIFTGASAPQALTYNVAAKIAKDRIRVILTPEWVETRGRHTMRPAPPMHYFGSGPDFVMPVRNQGVDMLLETAACSDNSVGAA